MMRDRQVRDHAMYAISAYVINRTGKSQKHESKLPPSDGARNNKFGTSVSISGNYVVVGVDFEMRNKSEPGSAYVFKRTGTRWTQEAKLLPSDGASNDHFGFSVSISGHDAVVGANGDDDNGGGSGSAYVFKSTGTCWTQEVKLSSSDGA